MGQIKSITNHFPLKAKFFMSENVVDMKFTIYYTILITIKMLQVINNLKQSAQYYVKQNNIMYIGGNY